MAAPLFAGTIFFVRIRFTIQNQNNAVISVRDADIATAVAYAAQAAIPISKYAAQYGPNNVTVSASVLSFDVSLKSNTYTDHDLQAYVNTIASQNRLPSSACVAVLNPEGIINTTFPLSQGVGGYHDKANVAYLMVNMTGQNLTIDDPGFLYAGALSHEIAEMVVDPSGGNPEVCDPCGPNCPSTFLNYFDDSGRYIATSQAFPPPFAYHFFINGIVRPAFALLCVSAPPDERLQLCARTCSER